MKQEDLLLMQYRTKCYGIMERCVRETENITCSIRCSRSGSFTCVLHARGGVGDEIVDSESQTFHLSDTRHDMISKYDLLTQFVWLNEEKRKSQKCAWAFPHAYHVKPKIQRI